MTPRFGSLLWGYISSRQSYSATRRLVNAFGNNKKSAPVFALAIPPPSRLPPSTSHCHSSSFIILCAQPLPPFSSHKCTPCYPHPRSPASIFTPLPPSLCRVCNSLPPLYFYLQFPSVSRVLLGVEFQAPCRYPLLLQSFWHCFWEVKERKKKGGEKNEMKRIFLTSERFKKKVKTDHCG